MEPKTLPPYPIIMGEESVNRLTSCICIDILKKIYIKMHNIILTYII